MRVIGLAGWSGAGKTTLFAKVIPRLVARGLRVSTIKHAHHAFDVDQPGKDSHTHRAAGATEVLVSSANRWALVHELRGVIAADVIAPVDLRPFDNSAVDGFAVRHADLHADGETRLEVVDRVMAGHPAGRALALGQAIRIFTGAPMPKGADTVFMQEDCRIDGDAVIVPAGLKLSANRR